MNSWPWRKEPEPRLMSCMQVQRVLQPYLDGEIDEVTMRRVAAHLDECRRCGLEATVYREIKAALTRGESPDPGAVVRLRDFGEALLRRGDAQDGEVVGG